MNVTQIVDASPELLVSQIVEKAVSSISHNWQQGRSAHVVLTGGRTGVQIAQTLDTDLFRLINSDIFSDEKSDAVLTTHTLHIWFSDERFTSLSDPDRTDTKLISSFEKCAQVPEIEIEFHRVSSPEKMTLKEAADAYAEELETSLTVERFDAVLLSMGEDGHIASLFPGLSTTGHSTKSAVPVDNSPKPPAERVSISVDRLANASAIYIFALGEGKREALTGLLSHKIGPVALLIEAAKSGQMVIATDLKI